MNDSIPEKAAELHSTMKVIRDLSHGINDYGDITGFCEEHDQIVNDAHALIGSLLCRATLLRRRLRLHKEKEPK